ncbi:major facilitator superfamily domain-containing protein [Lentinula boryana]|uniref:Major facilitator superfamily domain-containing protein n=1 Tax=Lentinula boryana TaxID=40481 RepID=A0ABQ8Q5Y9_9AGAR|nr:major facilitator superfamily domain-containing protein [Lentinula boryana]
MEQHRPSSTPPSPLIVLNNTSNVPPFEFHPTSGYTDVVSTGHPDSDLCGVDPNANPIHNAGSSTAVADSATAAFNPINVAEKDSLVDCLESQSSLSLTSSSYDPASGLRKTPELSFLRLLSAHIGAALTLFLATTDATIVSTSLPSIAADLDASESQYTWVGVAYLLTQTAFQPLYGRISDIVGRMNIEMLIASRALAGIGGGGIVSCVWVITAEIVEMRQRAKWSQALSITWSCSAVAGPLLGGLFSGKDLLLLKDPGLNHVEYRQSDKFCQLEMVFLPQSSSLSYWLLDPGRGSSRLTILVIVFLHNAAFNAGTFYLALFYQAADGYSPLEAGIQMLPYSLGASLASLPTAWFISWWQKRRRDTGGQNLVISFGFLISALGFALLNLLSEDSRMVFQDVFPLLAGIGMGILFHPPYQVFGRAFKSSELATCTSAFFLVRFTGATVGLAVAGAVFDARIVSQITPNMNINLGSSIDFSTLKYIQPSSLRAEVLHIVSTSIQTVWIVCTPLLGVAFLMSFLLKKFTIEEEEVSLDDKATTTDEKIPAEENV